MHDAHAMRGEPSTYEQEDIFQDVEPLPPPPIESQPFDASVPGAVSQRFNPFTPISVTDRLRTASTLNRPLASLPPKPGQLYAYDLDRTEAEDLDAVESYQQAYWQTLRETAPEVLQPPHYPPPLPPMRPPVLYDDQAELGDYVPQPIMPAHEDAHQAAFSADSYGYVPDPRAGNAQYQQEYGYGVEPYPAADYANEQELPEDLYHELPRPSPVKRLRGSLANGRERLMALLSPHGRHQRGAAVAVSPLRLGLLIFVMAAIVCCIVMMANILASLENAQKENKAWRESYYQSGGAAQGALVQLPVGGATFAPAAATSVPTASPVPTPRIQIADNLVGVDLATPTPASSARSPRTAYQNNPELQINERFTTLRAQNRNIVGWINMGGLDCPVMQTGERLYYQSHDTSGAYSNEGAIYIDSAVNLKTPPENLIVYGNNNESGKQFAHLAKYASGGIEYLRLYPFIQLDTIYEDGQFVIIAVIPADTNPASAQYFNYSGYSTFPSDKAYLSYIAAARRRSLYDVSVDVSVSDELLTLCTQGDQGGTTRLIVLCRRLRAGETKDTLPLSINSKENE